MLLADVVEVVSDVDVFLCLHVGRYLEFEEYLFFVFWSVVFEPSESCELVVFFAEEEWGVHVSGRGDSHYYGVDFPFFEVDAHVAALGSVDANEVWPVFWVVDCLSVAVDVDEVEVVVSDVSGDEFSFDLVEADGVWFLGDDECGFDEFGFVDGLVSGEEFDGVGGHLASLRPDDGEGVECGD